MGLKKVWYDKNIDRKISQMYPKGIVDEEKDCEYSGKNTRGFQRD